MVSAVKGSHPTQIRHLRTVDSAPVSESAIGRYENVLRAITLLADELRLLAAAGLELAPTDVLAEMVVARDIADAIGAAGLKVVTASALARVVLAQT